MLIIFYFLPFFNLDVKWEYIIGSLGGATLTYLGESFILIMNIKFKLIIIL